jgi:hypothetical protein
VAASDPRIAEAVRALMFFGGFYGVFSYMVSVASRTFIAQDGLTAWEPSKAVVDRFVPMLAAQEAGGLLKLFDATSRPEAEALLAAAPATERELLGRLNPAEYADGVRARIFILHDQGDTFVPYVESLKLRRALPSRQVGGFLLTDLFAHAQPKSGFSWRVARDIGGLYRFVRAVLAYV